MTTGSTPGPALPGPFTEVARRRPVAIIAPGALAVDREPAPGVVEDREPTPHPAPCAAVVVDLAPDLPDDLPDGVLAVGLAGPDGTRLAARLDLAAGRVALVTELAGDGGGAARTHRSRRHGRLRGRPVALALTLTGSQVVALVRETGPDGDHWVARARYDLRDRLDVHDPAWTAGLVSGWRWTGAAPAPVVRLRAGGFGQLGLRDVRLVTEADGSPHRPEAGAVLLSATSAGPGFFDTAHTSLWRLDLETLRVRHLSDLFFTRPERPGVFGDHATHVVRDGGRWLVATSTWGDFDPHRKGATVAVTLAETDADLLTGRHVLTTRALPLPVDGLASVGVWDPHLVRDDDGSWLVGYVSARRFFEFHPVLAAGPDLDTLTLRGAARGRTATEGTTLLRLDGGTWRVLASDGRDNPRRHRERYPAFDLDLHETGALEAPYPTNIPWPTLVPPVSPDGRWLLVTFNGVRAAGDLTGYGTHGQLVILSTDPARRDPGIAPTRREVTEKSGRPGAD